MSEQIEKWRFWQRKFEQAIKENGKFQKTIRQLERELAEKDKLIEQMREALQYVHDKQKHEFASAFDLSVVEAALAAAKGEKACKNIQ